MPNHPPPPAKALLPLGRTRASSSGQLLAHLHSHTTYTNPSLNPPSSIQMIAPHALDSVPSEALSRLNLEDRPVQVHPSPSELLSRLNLEDQPVQVHPTRTPPATIIEAQEVAIRALFQHLCTPKRVKKRVKALISIYGQAERVGDPRYVDVGALLSPRAEARKAIRNLELPPALEGVLVDVFVELNRVVLEELAEFVAMGELSVENVDEDEEW